VYVRDEAIYVISQAETATGLSVRCAPVLTTRPDAEPHEVGTAALKALALSQQQAPLPEEYQDKQLYRRLGFKNWLAFVRGARNLGVTFEGGIIRVYPSTADRGRGFRGMPDTETRTCLPEPGAVGETILERLSRCTADGMAQLPPAPELIAKAALGQVETEDESPVPFGYKNGWLAVQTEDTYAVAQALHLQESRSATWKEGIEQAYQDALFVAPPVDGWTLAVGAGLPWPESSDWIPFMQHLSTRLGSVQFFCTHRVVDFHGWARAEDGNIVRAYAREGWGVVRDIGAKTQEETDLGFNFLGEDATEEEAEAYWERDELTTPDEECVMRLAERWSIDPTQLGSYESTGLGLLGKLPEAMK
jgi:hypothetical protein